MSEPPRLRPAFVVVRVRAVAQLGGARRREARDRDAALGNEVVDVCGEARQDGHVADTLTRAARAEVAELARERRRPRRDAPREPRPLGDDLPLRLDDPARKLDLPELSVHPDRQVLRAAGMDARAALLESFRLDPRVRLPAKAGERSDCTGGEELVRDHPARHPLNASSSRVSSSGGSASSRRPLAVIVVRICSRYAPQPSQNTRCSSKRSRSRVSSASSRYAVTSSTMSRQASSRESFISDTPRVPPSPLPVRGGEALAHSSPS